MGQKKKNMWVQVKAKKKNYLLVQNLKKKCVQIKRIYLEMIK